MINTALITAGPTESIQHQRNGSYVMFLTLALMGYACFGRGFAYLGFRPIYIGEITLFLGVMAALRSRCFVASLATVPSVLLLVEMIWVTLRTVPYFGVYGFDAFRDSVVVMYGIFAFVVTALLLENYRRIFIALKLYARFSVVFICVVPFFLFLSSYCSEYVPNLPGTNQPIIDLRPGEVAVHLAGATIFAIVGFRQMGRGSAILVLIVAAMVATSSRGGFLAFVIPVIFASILMGKARMIARVVTVCLMMLAAVYAVESVSSNGSAQLGQRSVSAHQLVENATSIFGDSDEATESTKEWRLRWWAIIFNDTLHGPHFWTGRGFGINLADADGFVNGLDPGAPPLRSPHNAHMTILARGGVPGVTLWFCLLLSWFALVGKAFVGAQLRGERDWAALFAFVGCYQLAMIINATFDVALEGPMLGIWFWCLFGFGIGSVMIYRVGRTMYGARS